MRKTDGRDMQEHQKENKITDEKADDEKKEREKDLEHKICVITWNVNKSSAQYDLLPDKAHSQANVVMSQGTNGTAEELVWTMLKENKEGKPAIVKRNKMNFLRHSRRSTR